MAKNTKGDEVVGCVAPTLTAEQSMMNLQLFARVTILASPPVALQHFKA